MERRQLRDGKHFYLKLFYLHIMILLVKYFFKTLIHKLFKFLPETFKQNILSTFSQNPVHNTTHFYSYEIYIICLYTTIRCILARIKGFKMSRNQCFWNSSFVWKIKYIFIYINIKRENNKQYYSNCCNFIRKII